MPRTIKHFVAILDLQTLVVTLLAVVSTYLCLRYELIADVPTGLIGLAVVFPIVFSINAAYRRREEALSHFGEIKGYAVALYYGHRDWLSASGRGDVHGDRMRRLVEELLTAIRDDLSTRGRSAVSMGRVYETFSALSRSHEEMRKDDLGVSEISRANQYLGKIVVAYERMRNISNYRTPQTLRAYSHVFLNVFPIAFGPYFAFVSSEAKSFMWVGYVVAVLYSLVLVSLDNLQEHLEDPFDELGSDDVRLDVIDEYRPLIER